jgi:hypothetical protein
VSGCAASSLLRREEGDCVIDILTDTGDDSREDEREEIDTGTDIDTGADIEVGNATDTLIEVECCRVGS